MGKTDDFKIEYFTSMDKKYYDHCGKAMIHSFATNFKSQRLNLYNEGWFTPTVGNKSLFLRGWNLGKQYNLFQRRWKDTSRTKQFAKKAYSIIDGMNKIDCDRLVWLDADTIVKAGIPAQLIRLMCPDDTLSAHFGVWHQQDEKWYFSCETGFFILNQNHEHYQKFVDIYTRIYDHDDTEGMRRFYDGEVYGKALLELKKQVDVRYCELNPGKHKTPISRSVMAPYINHYKAGVKENLNNGDLIELVDSVNAETDNSI